LEAAEAARALEALEPLHADLQRIRSQLAGSEDVAASTGRFDRWKARTVSVIASAVNSQEAERFQKTYVPIIMSQGEYNALDDAMERYEASLRVLIEEIRERPEGVATDDRAVSQRQMVIGGSDVSMGDPDPRAVFVIHGRDEQARTTLFEFLQDLDLHPMQWEELVRKTGKGSPYNGEVVARAFREARAVVVLMTPDDEARLHPDLQGAEEPEFEVALTGQPRPNVFLEAGIALQAQPDRTIFVEIGRLRPASDLDGLNAVRLGSEGALLALVMRLETAGCAVNRSNPKWMDPRRFTELAAITRRPELRPSGSSSGLPRGTKLASATPKPAPPALSARLFDRGRNHLLEVVNRGGVTLSNVRWELPAGANWAVMTQVLPVYPIPELQPREHIRVPVMLVMGSAAMVEIALIAEAEGQPFRTKARLSIYD
jgi:predicted nucleotide-binding protein